MKKIMYAGLFVTCATTTSFSFFDGCLDKRLPRELEFKLVYECVRTGLPVTRAQMDKKIKACSCFIGSVICEEGKDALMKCENWERCNVKHDRKKMEKCLEEEKE